MFLVPTTERDVAYRNVDPGSNLCQFAQAQGWSVLGDSKSENGETVKIDNNERLAIDSFPKDGWDRKFACALQRHRIAGANGEDLFYNLAFVEFKEDGTPYELFKDLGSAFSPEDLASRVRFVDSKQRLPITQLGAVTRLLRQNADRNYVIVFIHGWRHDARLGDDNVAALRRYAGHAARFLRDRCKAGEKEQCDRVVTAVYIGWRGARIDEDSIMAPFVALGKWLDGKPACREPERTASVKGPPPPPKCWRTTLTNSGANAASAAAAITLFDRKPVSEAIAPHVFTALRSLESALNLSTEREKPDAERVNTRNRLLVIGHSLGGNLLATALERDVVKRVEWQARRNDDLLIETKVRAASGAIRIDGGKDSLDKRHVYFDPPLGNLVVLINPAAEARKWTSIQRAVWQKIQFRSAEGTEVEFEQGHDFFPDYQRPVMIAVTSAFAWPPGGIRVEDCAIASNFNKDFRDDPPPKGSAADDVTAQEQALDSAIKAVDKKSKEGGVIYDSATHDLFPFFKFDFRPMADRLDRYGRWLADRRVPRLSCAKDDEEIASWRARLLIKMAAILRDAPFQQSDMEETRTIGNLDVPRHAAGNLTQYLTSSKPFGTTHEIRAQKPDKKNRSIAYWDLAANADFKCPLSDLWLDRAKRFRKLREPDSHGTYWNSDQLAPPLPDENPRAEGISAEIYHGFDLAGMAAITRPNDPFWNVRAYDDVIAEHGGYKLSSFICAINQLVMDEPTRIPSEKPRNGEKADVSGTPSVPAEIVPAAAR
jgi:hypothetical protein